MLEGGDFRRKFASEICKNVFIDKKLTFCFQHEYAQLSMNDNHGQSNELIGNNASINTHFQLLRNNLHRLNIGSMNSKYRSGNGLPHCVGFAPYHYI